MSCLLPELTLLLPHPVCFPPFWTPLTLPPLLALALALWTASNPINCRFPFLGHSLGPTAPCTFYALHLPLTLSPLTLLLSLSDLPVWTRSQWSTAESVACLHWTVLMSYYSKTFSLWYSYLENESSFSIPNPFKLATCNSLCGENSILFSFFSK